MTPKDLFSKTIQTNVVSEMKIKPAEEVLCLPLLAERVITQTQFSSLWFFKLRLLLLEKKDHFLLKP